ncbi:purine catabolism regulator [Paenibacillus phyllosphaerae]|uniref:Purine catabolism regulator n=1 Tax=Paenibacillus phyllosphaerae TaxID=274593 RepID=A0A7W5FRD2_9BACL|nr:PucR family transcriptional regulator [Paenibacillus phyllosphaerae]MBB3114401.1 purine catabolism regulator [Paenibacillus phyllosphaerae]
MMERQSGFGVQDPFKAKHKGGDNTAASFTVQDLLGMPLLSKAQLISKSGSTGLNRAVNRVNIVELLEDLQWVRPGEFVMTTARPFKDHPGRFLNFIAAAAEKGASAFGIRLNMAADSIPGEAVQAAERFALPLLALPPDAAFADIVRETMEHVLTQEAEQLVQIQDRIQLMSRLLVSGGGMHVFLDQMESMLGNPVALVRHGKGPSLSMGLRGKLTAGEVKLHRALWHQLEEMQGAGGKGFWYYTDTGAAITAVSLAGGRNANRLYAAEIARSQPDSAYLVLMEQDQEIKAVDALTIDRLSALAGLELSNAEALREVEGKYLEQFLQDWLTGKLLTKKDVLLRAEVAGCPLRLDLPLQAVLVEWGISEPSDTADLLRSAVDAINAYDFETPEQVLASVCEGELVLVLSSSEPITAEFADTIEGLCGMEGISLYAGNKVMPLERLSSSLMEAKRTRQAASICRLTGKLVQYDELGIYSLLYLIPRGEEWQSVLSRYIEPLLFSDRKGGSLMETIDAFFRCNGNVRLTSEMLETHYNTVVYRLEKARQLLNVNLDDSEIRLQLQLAIKMYRMNEPL